MKLLILVILTIGLLNVQAGDIYNYKKSYITPLTNFNFNQQINHIRSSTSQVSIVQYFKQGDGFSQDFATEFDQWVADNNGLFRVGAVDCDENASLCEKERITTFPTFRVYPPTPNPIIDISDDISVQKIQKTAARELMSKATEVTNTNIEAWLKESPSVPKVVLFTKSEKGVPLMYKGLSVAFEGKLMFGIVRSSDDILVQRYKVKDFPTIIVLKNLEKKWDTYSGEIKYKQIFNWLNIFSQTFVPGGGDTSNVASKEWMTEVVPELYQKSANDICLQTENTLCVIHIGKGKPEKSLIDDFKSLNTAYDRKIERGSKFKFMWLDSSVETEWAEAFNASGENTVVVLNPGKRKRYVKHEGELNYDSLKQTLEKISGGDARFTRVELPSQFAYRK